MDKSRILKEEGKVSFSNREELIQFVSNYLSLEYKEHLEFWRTTAVDTPREANWWRAKMESEVPKFEAAIAKLLRRKLHRRKRVNITHKSTIIKNAFEMAEIGVHPEGCFSVNVEYKINKLVFEKIVKPSY